MRVDFSVWLQGALRDEAIAVEIWEYGADGESLQHAVAPFVLFRQAAALLRADTDLEERHDGGPGPRPHLGFPQAVDVVIDQSSLTKSETPSVVGGTAGDTGVSRVTAIEQPLLGLGFERPLQLHLERVTWVPPRRVTRTTATSGCSRAEGPSLLACSIPADGWFTCGTRSSGSAPAVSFDRALILWSIGTWFVFMVNALTGPILSDPSFLLDDLGRAVASRRSFPRVAHLEKFH